MLRMISWLEDTYFFSVSSTVQSLKTFYYSIILLFILPQLLTEFMLNNFIHRKSISLIHFTHLLLLLSLVIQFYYRMSFKS